MHLHITQQVAGQHVVDLWFHAHSELFVVHLRHALAHPPNTRVVCSRMQCFGACAHRLQQSLLDVALLQRRAVDIDL
jgi:hypothetical protein